MKAMTLLFLLGALLSAACRDRASNAGVTAGGMTTTSTASASATARLTPTTTSAPAVTVTATPAPPVTATPTTTATATNNAARAVTLGTPFRLAVGERVSLPWGGTLSLDAVVDDSRCPTDVICVWAGEATAAFASTGADGTAHTWRIVIGAAPGEAAINGSLLRVIDLRPYPRATAPIAPGDYVVTAVFVGAGTATPPVMVTPPAGPTPPAGYAQSCASAYPWAQQVKVPFVCISEPVGGASLSLGGPLEVSGYAGGSFENNVVIEVQRILASGSAAAEALVLTPLTYVATDAGMPGFWRTTLTLPSGIAPGPLRVVARFNSPRDGTLVAEATVDITLQ